MVNLYRQAGAEGELEQLLQLADRAISGLVQHSHRAHAGEAMATPTWRDYLRASAANRIGRIQGLNRQAVEQRLQAAGFRPYRDSVTGSVTWQHSDGSGVRVDPGHRPSRGPTRGGYPSDLRVHYHKYVDYPGGTRILLNDRGRAIPIVLDARGRQVPRHPQRAHILSGRRQAEGEQFKLRPQRRQMMIPIVRVLDSSTTPNSYRLDRNGAMALLSNLAQVMHITIPGVRRGTVSRQALQNQINRPRWRFLKQFPAARARFLRALTGTGVTIPAWL